MASTTPVCLPVHVDAFILNGPVASKQSLAIAPITQPNYVSMRLSNNVLQHDILPAVDLHNSAAANKGSALGNPRVSSVYSAPFGDLEPRNPDPPPGQAGVSLNQSRFGVYLHWSVPRGYRAGSSADTGTTADDDDARKRAAQPTFRQVPNRWLVVRLLRSFSPPSATIDKVSAWMVESDRLRTLDKLPPSTDLEMDVTPFVAYQHSDLTDDPGLLDAQAERYIGYKTPLQGWSEDAGAARVPLTTMNSSNPLFADHVPHNANVFSTLDNFGYGPAGNPKFLTQATADYVILGWHADPAAPMAGSAPTTDPLRDAGDKKSLGQRLQAMHLQSSSAATDPTSMMGDARLICHRALYNVGYDAGAPVKSAVDDYAARFDPSNPKFDVDFEPVAERVKAADAVYAHNYARTGGGSVWRYDKKKTGATQSPAATSGASGGVVPSPVPVPSLTPVPTAQPPAKPSPEEVAMIEQLNDGQRQLDAAESKLKLLQWSLFSEFFKYCSDAGNAAQDTLNMYITRAQVLSAEAHALDTQAATLRKTVDGAAAALGDVKKCAGDPFFSRADPTLCLAGLDAGWPTEMTGSAPTRFAGQVAPPKDATLASAVMPALDKLLQAMPVAKSLKMTLTSLIHEAAGGPQDGIGDSLGHTKWSGLQPFRPQFIEWSGIYYHVGDFDTQWDLGINYTGTSESNHEQLRYVNNNGHLAANATRWQKDSRRLTGRILILPQPSFALEAVVRQVLSSARPEDLPDSLKDPDDAKHDQQLKDDFSAAAGRLPFVSGQLTGLTDALLTLVGTGSHVKPNLREAGQLTTPMQAAINAVLLDPAKDTHLLTTSDFGLMAGETAKTPFGTLADFSGQLYPFKGVTHGQLALTHITVVDKFAQALACPPTHRTLRDPTGPPEFVYPCIADQLLPTVLDDGTLNTVFGAPEPKTKSGYPMSPFVQLTPAINQDARINATLLQRDVVLDADGAEKGFVRWRPSSDWDNPIFGWVVVNYADSALQFFTGEGIFYTSARFGGPTGTFKADDWLPFGQPVVEKDEKLMTASPQLKALVAEMVAPPGAGDASPAAKYLVSLWKTIDTAIQSMPFSSGAYAHTANAIVGKPLALVNAGWSLELAQPPLWAQHTLPMPGSFDPKSQKEPLRQRALQDMEAYDFKFKIGDRDRTYDGVVSYWDLDPASPGATDFHKGFYCFSKPPTPPDKLPDVAGFARTFIEPASFPKLSPYFLDPDDTTLKKAQAGSPSGVPTDPFLGRHAAKLVVKTLLVDPLAPLHVYTGILPIKTLQLPAWTLSEPMRNMTAFFSLGPVLLTRDVPKTFEADREATATSWMDQPSGMDGQVEDVNLPLAATKGQWKWLQPYSVPAASGTDEVTRFMSLAVGHDDGRPRTDPAPHTMVEGFLQLATPIVAAAKE